MESKEKIIKDIQFYTIQFNEYWEDPITKSELVKNTYETCDLIIAYCNVIKAKKKKLGLIYDQHPKDVQEAISKVISLVSDGRDLWHKVKYEHINTNTFGINSSEPREYDHHVNETGYLDFEDDPMCRCQQIIDECETLKEVIDSEKETKNFEKFVGKILYWENYESGSCCIKIDKINKNSKGAYTFDGVLLSYETVNGSCDGDGYIMTDVEDYPLKDLPYCYQEWDTEEDVYESLDCAEIKELKDVYKDLYNTTKNLFEQYFRCRINVGCAEEWGDDDEEAAE